MSKLESLSEVAVAAGQSVNTNSTLIYYNLALLLSFGRVRQPGDAALQTIHRNDVCRVIAICFHRILQYIAKTMNNCTVFRKRSVNERDFHEDAFFEPLKNRVEIFVYENVTKAKIYREWRNKF